MLVKDPNKRLQIDEILEKPLIKKTVELLDKRLKAKEERRRNLGKEKDLKTLYSEYLEAGQAQTVCLFCGHKQDNLHVCDSLYLSEEVETLRKNQEDDRNNDSRGSDSNHSESSSSSDSDSDSDSKSDDEQNKE